MIQLFTETLQALPKREVCRYMGVQSSDSSLDMSVEAAEKEFLGFLRCKACWMIVPVAVEEPMVKLGDLWVESEHLARNLCGCKEAALFAATIGIDADRAVRTAEVKSPVQALMFDAMGSAAIECLCDDLCVHIASHYPHRKMHPRFSPGYGDLPIGFQRDLVTVLNAQRQIGLTLTEHLMMIPRKSVTAIVGIE